MASPPPSPLHRRQSSNFSMSSRRSSRRLSQSLSLSRRSSAGFGSPTQSRLGSSHGHGDSLALELGGEGFGDSLADELGGWSGEEEEDPEEEGQGSIAVDEARQADQERDSGIDVASSPPGGKHLSPTTAKRSHKRNESAYDGSEYGSESDLEESELVSASLEARMSAIEAMARRGLEENGSDGDNVVSRVIDRLRDLGSQSDFEMGTTRLSTAFTALSTHLTNQTRILSQLTSHLFSPLQAHILPDTYIDDLIPYIETALATLPTLIPSSRPANSIHTLIDETSELIQDLNYLKDTLQVNQQTTTSGSRKLRAVKDLLRDTRTEMNMRDDSVRWIEQGCWDQRLKQREAQIACNEILSGFEEVCDGWGERLRRSVEVAAA